MNLVQFDAKDKVLGRLATAIANALRGKLTVGFRPDRLPNIKVIVNNAHLIAVTGRKETQKMYYRFSGYPGGLSKRRLADVRAAHPERLLHQAVRRMLPDNKLRDRLLKNLTINTK